MRDLEAICAFSAPYKWAYSVGVIGEDDLTAPAAAITDLVLDDENVGAAADSPPGPPDGESEAISTIVAPETSPSGDVEEVDIDV